MRCPFCRHDDTQVVDSRVSEDGAAIRRRRRCPACDKRFTTYERVELALPSVVKKDGSRTEFDRRKIVASMQLALRKRPVAADAVDAAVARIEYQLLGSGEREVRSERLGELVMNECASSTRLPTSVLPRCTAASKTCLNSKTSLKNFAVRLRRPSRPASADCSRNSIGIPFLYASRRHCCR
jgi:transcriptional repressor NrdR